MSPSSSPAVIFTTASVHNFLSSLCLHLHLDLPFLPMLFRGPHFSILLAFMYPITNSNLLVQVLQNRRIRIPVMIGTSAMEVLNPVGFLERQEPLVRQLLLVS